MTLEQMLAEHQKQKTEEIVDSFKEFLKDYNNEKDILKQKYMAEYFDISVNTLKQWVADGCPEIRLSSGMVLYSKKAIREWLLQFQK